MIRSKRAGVVIVGDAVHIELTAGQVAVVDLVDADLARFNWCAHRNGEFWYAWRNRQGSRGMIRMHRVIAERAGMAIAGLEVDRRDLDGLNNRRLNLRVATHAQNRQNTPLRSNNVSGCKGVHWDSARQKWHAIITANGKKKALGRFASIEEAADAYARAAKVLHGEFARIS